MTQTDKAAELEAELNRALAQIESLDAECDRRHAALEQMQAERDAALVGAVKVRPLKFEWAKDDSRPNPSCWRCEGDGFFAYVLIPYDPGNDPVAGTGKWNANPNHRGRMGFETREAAMAYCEEAIRRQAASEVKHAIDKLSLWAEPAIQPHIDSLQKRATDWALACFGADIARDKTERAHRFLEEALELTQACDCTKGEALQLVDYVFARDKRDVAREVGDVINTIAMLCTAHGVDMDDAGHKGLDRCWENIDKTRAKRAAKPSFSPLPTIQPDAEPVQPVAWMIGNRATNSETEAKAWCGVDGITVTPLYAHPPGADPK